MLFIFVVSFSLFTKDNSKFICEEYKSENPKKWTTVLFLLKRLLSCIFLVSFWNYISIQIVLIVAICLISILWNILIRPYKSKLAFAAGLSSDIGLLLIIVILCMLSNASLSEEAVEKYGDYAIYIFVTTSILTGIFSLSRNSYEVYLLYKMKQKQENQNQSIEIKRLEISKTQEIHDYSEVSKPQGTVDNMILKH